jgi:hypothetical protein
MDNAQVCHCRMCQKAAGNLFMALVGVPKADLSWTKGEPAVFRSSAQVERGFCRDCGTPLFFHHEENDYLSLTIGSFDDPGAILLTSEFAVEMRLPQVAQLGHLEQYFLADEADYVAGIAATNRQHPDHD